MPISTTTVSENAKRTRGGPTTKALATPQFAAQSRRCSRIAHNMACRTSTQTNGDSSAAIVLATDQRGTELNDSSQTDAKTTARGNGHSRQPSAKSRP